MKIFITDLAAYNKGALIGQWVDLPCDDLQEQIDDVLEKGTEWSRAEGSLADGEEHEEHFVTDYDCEFDSIGEYDDVFELNAQAEQFEQLDDHDRKKLRYLIDDGDTFEQAMEHLEDCDLYEDMTMRELAEEFVDEGLFGEIPARLQYYIDYDAIARDLQMDYTEHEGDIYRRN